MRAIVLMSAVALALLQTPVQAGPLTRESRCTGFFDCLAKAFAPKATTERPRAVAQPVPTEGRTAAGVQGSYLAHPAPLFLGIGY